MTSLAHGHEKTLDRHGNLPEEITHGFTMSLQVDPSCSSPHKCLTNTAIANCPLTSPKVRRQTASLRIRKTSTDRLRFCHAASNGSLTLCAQRLQGLFHSLSKVLFIFRSHYLFTIGLGAIFSLRRSTPAALHSTIKLRDSWSPRGSATPTRAYRIRITGRSPSLVTRSGVVFLTASSGLSPRPLHYNSTASDSFRCGFEPRLFPVHSPLLRESRLFSCPPLNDMLKFSGFSCIAEVAV